MKEETWEQRMARRTREREQARYDAQYQQWVVDAGPQPTDFPDGAPPCCFEWRVDGPAGWVLFRVCDEPQRRFARHGKDCDHEHHEGEVWLAAAS